MCEVWMLPQHVVKMTFTFGLIFGLSDFAVLSWLQSPVLGKTPGRPLWLGG